MGRCRGTWTTSHCSPALNAKKPARNLRQRVGCGRAGRGASLWRRKDVRGCSAVSANGIARRCRAGCASSRSCLRRRAARVLIGPPRPCVRGEVCLANSWWSTADDVVGCTWYCLACLFVRWRLTVAAGRGRSIASDEWIGHPIRWRLCVWACYSSSMLYNMSLRLSQPEQRGMAKAVEALPAALHLKLRSKHPRLRCKPTRPSAH